MTDTLVQPPRDYMPTRKRLANQIEKLIDQPHRPDSAKHPYVEEMITFYRGELAMVISALRGEPSKPTFGG